MVRPREITVEDIARLLTAVHLGLAATATLLVTAALVAVAQGARRVVVSGGFFVAGVGAIVVTLLRAEGRRAGALDGLAVLAAFSLPLLLPGGRALMRRLPPALLLATPVLRLGGLDALLAERAGWLPATFAKSAAALEGLAGLGALVVTLLAWRRGARALGVVRVGCALSVLAAGLTMALAAKGVRPLPAFEALYLGALLPLCAALHLAALVTLTPADPAATG